MFASDAGVFSHISWSISQVGFLVLFFIDGGESCVLQTARVRKDVEGEGVYSFMVKFCRNIAKEKGAKQTIVGNASLLKMYTKQLAKDQCDTIAHLVSHF